MGRELEFRRFVINPEPLRIMRRLRDSFRELQNFNNPYNESEKRYPFLSGLGIHGSSVKGVEKKFGNGDDDSDIDLVVFYNSERARRGVLGEAYKREMENELSCSSFEAPINYLHVDYCDISKMATQEQLDFLVESSGFSINNKSNLFIANLDLISRFFLACGEEVYENRKFILEKIELLPDRYKVYSTLSEGLAYFERNNDRTDKVRVPAYDRYPRTIEQAKKYFLIKKPGHMLE